MIQQKVRVGLLGVGLDTYWGQFEGLLPRLLTYQDEIAVKIAVSYTHLTLPTT